MSPRLSLDFDLDDDDIGASLERLDEYLPDPFIARPRPSWQTNIESKWWETSEAEEHFADYPHFTCVDDRIAFIQSNIRKWSE